MDVGFSKELEYQIIDHTADFGIRVFGSNAAELFKTAALALTDLITDRAALKGSHACRVRISGADWPDLMVNWLRELLYLWTGEEKLIGTVEIGSICENEVVADIGYARYSPGSHPLKNEIKAVTYHQIEVVDTGGLWKAQIIFDV